jgi:hypothetical protein
MKASGRESFVMERVIWDGLTELATKATGPMEWPTERGSSNIQMETLTRANTATTRPVAMEFTLTKPTVHDTRVSGRMKCSMVPGLKHGKKDPNTKGNTTKAWNKGKVAIPGQTARCMTACGWKIKYTALELTNGTTEDSTMECGLITTCTGMGSTSTPTGCNIMVSMTRTKNTVLEYIIGKMVVCIQAGGPRANNMDLEFIKTSRNILSTMGFGKWVKD